MGQINDCCMAVRSQGFLIDSISAEVSPNVTELTINLILSSIDEARKSEAKNNEDSKFIEIPYNGEVLKIILETTTHIETVTHSTPRITQKLTIQSEEALRELLKIYSATNILPDLRNTFVIKTPEWAKE